MTSVDARWMMLVAVLAGPAGCERDADQGAPSGPPPGLAAPAPPAPIIGRAGPNELLADEGWMPVAGTSRAAFEAMAATPPAKGPPIRLRALPAALPADAQLGTMWTGGAEQAVWIATGDARRGYTFQFDANLDGDLTNDPVHALAKDADGDWACDVAAEVPDPARSVLYPILFRVTIHAGEIAIVLTTQRRGVIDVAGRRVPFVLEGVMGRYGADKQAIAIDVDGDGRADTDPRGDEAFLVRDRRVTLGGASYDFAVASDGATLTLTPTPPGAALAGRPSLKTGAPAPGFAAADLAGNQVSLAGLRDKVVVLDFWARWCHPCVEAIPELAALEAKQRNAGLAMVSVVIEDEPDALRSFAAEHQMTWPQLAEPSGGPIQDAYRIVSVPEVYVIDRQGNLACSRCGGGSTLAAAVDAALRK